MKKIVLLSILCCASVLFAAKGPNHKSLRAYSMGNAHIAVVDDKEAIYYNWRVELWGEGFSFFDLKRWNEGIDRTYDGNNHLPGYQLKVAPRAKTWIYQIPMKEMNENKQLTAEDQNE